MEMLSSHGEMLRPGATSDSRRTTVWSAHVVRSCDPEVLSLIVALLLDGEELRALLDHGASRAGRAWSLAAMIRSTVDRARDDLDFAERLALHLGRQAEDQTRGQIDGTDESRATRWSPYEALDTWARRRDDISSAQIAHILSTLAFSRDPVLTSLAERLCREVQIEAIRRLRSFAPLQRSGRAARR